MARTAPFIVKFAVLAVGRGLYGFLSGLCKQCKPSAMPMQGKIPQIRLFRAAEAL
jgi:hypothetical protein